MDIIEHYIKNSSLVEIALHDFKKLVVEGKTDSDKLENAICMAFNIKHNGWTEETKQLFGFGRGRWLELVETKRPRIY